MRKLKNLLFGELSLRQTMFKNTFWLTVSNVGSNLLKLVVIIYAARLLGAQEYGLFAYALSIAATFTILSDLGLNSLITIRMAQRGQGRDPYFSTLMFLRTGLLVVMIVLTIALGPLLTKFPQARILIPMVAFLIAFDDLRALMNSTARARNRMDKEAFGYLTTNVLTVLLCLVGLRYSSTSYMLTLMYLIGSALGTFAMFFTVKEDVSAILRQIRFHLPLAKDIFAAALPLGLSSAMWTLMVNTDTLLVGWFRTAAELGLYAAAQRPIAALYIVPTVMVGGSLSLIARLVKEGAQERLKSFIERLIVLSMAIILPLTVGGAILAPSLIYFLYGTEYAGATLSFQLLLVTLLISYPSSIVSNFVLAYGRQKIFILAMIAGALGNVALDLLLIPPFGIAGSVIATIGALGVIYGYIWYRAKKIQPFVIATYLPRIILATVLMGFLTLALHLASLNVFVNVFVSGMAYLGILIMAREPLLRDLKGLVGFASRGE